MENRSNIPPDDFDRLLRWFGPDRDISAKKYLEAHERLTRWFHFKGCNRPEDLADEVVDRVAKKLPPPNPDHIALLLGYARNVLHEHWRERIRFDEERDPSEEPAGMDETALNEMLARCLDNCLERLPQKDDRQLLLEYHKYELGGKIQWRKAMAAARHTTLNALRLKACRLKSVVADCVKRCCQSGGETEVQ
jgi:hypothetical protein